MPMDRRHILKSFGALTALPFMSMVARGQNVSGEAGADLQRIADIKPPALKSGSRIGIACPASGVTKKELRDFVRLCESFGWIPVLGRNVAKSEGYLSAPDADRADELKEFIDDTTIHAIVCARGGYGVMRILPLLDYRAIGEAGKLIMGFSDITALLVAVNQLSGVVTFHGPVATSSFDSFTVQSFASTVTAEKEIRKYRDDKLTVIAEGFGRGRLTGGNLSMVVATLGTNYEIQTEGSILFLEEIDEEPYRIDRMLTQLWLAGKLQKCNGIALGNFKNCELKGRSTTYPSYRLHEVLQDRLRPLGIPVVYGLPFGHVKSKLTLPLGVEAELDATNRSLQVLETAVTA